MIKAVPFAGMFLLALLLWLPFSFKTTGLIEEWGVALRLDSGSQLFFITPNSGMSMHRMRPFEVFYHALAYALDPDSFLFYNVFQFLFVFGKMAAAYWLVLQFLPRHRLVAFLASVLFVLYPADTALFTFRALHIHGAILAFLLSANLLILFVKRERPGGGPVLLFSGILLMFSLMMYQVALPLALVTPFAMLAFTRGSDRRLWLASGVWYLAIAVPALYAIWALNQNARVSYEMELVDVNSAAPSALAGMFEAITLAYQRQVTAWGAIWHKLDEFPQLRGAAAAGLAVFAAIGAWFMRLDRRDPAAPSLPRRRYIIVMIGGLLIVAIGMAVFLPLPARRLQDFRIYLLSMFGSGLALSLLLFGISRLLPRDRDIVLLVLALPFIALSYTNALQQHQYYVNYSLVEQQVLQDTLAQAPRLAPGSFVLVADRTGFMDDGNVFLFGFYLQTGLQYLYKDRSLEAAYCPVGGTGSLQTRCVFGKESVHITRSAPGTRLDVTVPYDRMVFLTNDTDDRLRLLTPAEMAAEFGATRYNPAARITGSAHPDRASRLFSCVPARECHGEALAPSQSFDLPATGPIGTGWRTAEADGAGGTFRWSMKRLATVDVNLEPATDLMVEFYVRGWLDSAVIDSLTLSFGDVPIPISYDPVEPGSRSYRAVVPRELLARSAGPSQLVFRVSHLAPVPGSPDVELAFALNWLRIRPRER